LKEIRVIFTLAVGQFRPRIGDLEHNRGTMLQLGRQARDLGADLLILPELCLSGYLLRDQVFSSGLALDDPFLDPLLELSTDLSLVFGFVEKSADQRYFNAAAYLEGGRVVHRHRKVYLPTYGLFEEKRFFAEGERIQAFDSRFGRTGLLVCNDLWHPSAPYLLAMDGADLILVVSASPTRGVSEEEVSDNTRIWDLLLAHTAKTSSSFVAYANLCGYQDGVNFWGGSRVYGPHGRILAQAGLHDAGVVAATLDTEMLRRERIYSPLRRDERLLLTWHELERIVREKYQ